MKSPEPYNPLDKTHLGASVAEAMLRTPLEPLGGLEPFQGAGIYALYYLGGFEPYAPLVREGAEAVPIYVGKAAPPGARQGKPGLAAYTGTALSARLRQHAESIRAARTTLDIKDFSCRYLVVDDIWIPLGESLLIAKFSPLWNTLLDGFGNHDPGKGRHAGMIPRWDVLHPGRAWAAKCQPRPETSGDIARDIQTFLRSQIIPGS